MGILVHSLHISIMVLLWFFNASCISLGDEGEYHIVVFLNNHFPSEDNDSGLRMFTDEYTQCLRDHGVTKSPKIHPEFLSTLGSLGVEIPWDCQDFHSEVVPRETNRIVVLSPKETFRFENRVGADEERSDEFAESTQLALVFVFA